MIPRVEDPVYSGTNPLRRDFFVEPPLDRQKKPVFIEVAKSDKELQREAEIRGILIREYSMSMEPKKRVKIIPILTDEIIDDVFGKENPGVRTHIRSLYEYLASDAIKDNRLVADQQDDLKRELGEKYGYDVRRKYENNQLRGNWMHFVALGTSGTIKVLKRAGKEKHLMLANELRPLYTKLLKLVHTKDRKERAEIETKDLGPEEKIKYALRLLRQKRGVTEKGQTTAYDEMNYEERLMVVKEHDDVAAEVLVKIAKKSTIPVEYTNILVT